MSLPTRLPYGLFALVTIAAAMLLSSFEARVEAQRADLRLARSAFGSAAEETRTRLVQLTSRATEDHALQQNLSWNLNHSVNAALTARLSPGMLDQLQVVEASCAPLAEAGTLKAAMSGRCEPKRPEFRWREEEDGTPVLSILVPIGAQRALIGSVRLGRDWLALFPMLAAAKERHALELKRGGKRERGVIASEGDAQSGEAFATLSATSTTERLLARDLSPLGQGHRRPVMRFGATLALLLTVAQLLQSRAQAKHAQKISRSFSEKEGHAKAIETELWQKRRELKTLEKETSDQRRDIDSLKGRVAARAGLESLAMQVKGALPELTQIMAEGKGLTEKLTHELRESVVSEARTLSELTHAWQRGVAERGARKFLRGLSETEGRHVGKSRLDEELAALAHHTESIARDGAGALAVAERILAQASQAERLNLSWLRAASELLPNGPEGVPSRDWRPALADAAALLACGDQRLVPAELPGEAQGLPAVPRSALTSALFHVCSAAAAPGTTTEAKTLASRMRRDGDKSLLVLSLAKSVPVGPGSSAEHAMSHHLDLARAILSPYGIEVERLPTRDGTAPVALSWNSNVL